MKCLVFSAVNKCLVNVLEYNDSRNVLIKPFAFHELPVCHETFRASSRSESTRECRKHLIISRGKFIVDMSVIASIQTTSAMFCIHVKSVCLQHDSSEVRSDRHSAWFISQALSSNCKFRFWYLLRVCAFKIIYGRFYRSDKSAKRSRWSARSC